MTIRPPLWTVSLIVLNVLIFLYQYFGTQQFGQVIYEFGLIPGNLTGASDALAPRGGFPATLTIFTSMFLHGGWMHLGGNMLFLWIFGNNIEDVLGHGRFILFYLAAGVAAAFAQVFVDPASEIPMVGASGAISGILGAYIILFPRAKILTLIFLGFFITWLRIRAVWFLGIWFAIQSFNVLLPGSSEGGVAFRAHIGGFVAGAALLFVLKPKKYLFGNKKKGPWG